MLRGNSRTVYDNAMATASTQNRIKNVAIFANASIFLLHLMKIMKFGDQTVGKNPVLVILSQVVRVKVQFASLSIHLSVHNSHKTLSTGSILIF